MTSSIPAFYRQEQIKEAVVTLKKKSRKDKYCINYEDKNIPTVIRRQLEQELDKNPDLQRYVFKHDLLVFMKKFAQMQQETIDLVKALKKYRYL